MKPALPASTHAAKATLDRYGCELLIGTLDVCESCVLRTTSPLSICKLSCALVRMLRLGGAEIVAETTPRVHISERDGGLEIRFRNFSGSLFLRPGAWCGLWCEGTWRVAVRNLARSRTRPPCCTCLRPTVVTSADGVIDGPRGFESALAATASKSFPSLEVTPPRA
jgi:hypothetical protein